jgi:hypothetical protein
MHDSAEVLRGLTVGGPPGLGVVPYEDLGAVALALGDHADVEPGVEQLGRRELAEGEDRAVEGGTVAIATGPRCFPALG